MSDSELLLFHAPDGTHFEQQDVIAQGFDSLGLTQQTGRVVVTGMNHRRLIPWYERYQRPAVHELVWQGSSSGKGWRIERTRVAVDAPALIDPQWQGEALWYVARSGMGDPALGGMNRVMKGADVELEGTGLADPSPVTFNGRELLFTTRWGDGVVLWGGSPWTEQASWRQLTVPFARVEAGLESGLQASLLAVYAVGVVDGSRLPVRMESVDGVHFTQPKALSLSPTPSSCTSPVVWSDADGHWLLCVREATPSGPPK
ncbi:MAG: hypothetical protein ACI9VR_002012 [Cognaticolwellia sp.]